MAAPTLLLGLGGLGSFIVQSVYARIPQDQRSLVRVHILDTDVQELQDERYRELLSARCVTQTSPPITVKECVSRLAERTRVNHWFPGARSGSTTLDYKKMVDGASQFRAISRLAVLDTIVSGRIGNLDATLDSLRTAQGKELQQAVRVMIVNSIAGGTGSGSFLQLAMYVRSYFENNLKTKNVVVRGIVVMPEVFVKNGDYKAEDLISNVRANGYAALKEVDALTRLRAGRLKADKNPDAAPLAPIELECVPGQADASSVGEGAAPLDIVFLYDYTNANGENIGGKSNYIRQVMDAIYLQLFSPLEGSGGIYSQEDNLILTLVREQDRARYASSAVARLIYPYHDMLDYCALKWATSGLSEEWLEVDRLIRDEFEQIERDRRDGIHRDKPDPQVRLVEIVRMKAGAEKPHPFYRNLFREAHLLDQQGEAGEPKSELWLTEIDKRIAAVVAQADAAARSHLYALNVEHLKNKDHIVSQVELNERGLESYREAMAKAVQPLANMIVKEALWDDYRRGRELDRDNDLHLNTWLLGRTEAIHPLAVRYFLGEAWQGIKDKLARAESALSRLEKSISGYKNRWDDPETQETETAASVARKHAGANAFQRLLKRDLQPFAEDYQASADTQKQSIRKWSSLKVERDVMGLLLGHVQDMLTDWERFFRQLQDVQGTCERDAGLLARKHDSNNDPTCIYVLASEAHKAALWDDEGIGMRAKDLPEDVARQIYLAMYRHRAAQHFDEAQAVDGGTGWIEKLFREQVVGWCRRELAKSPGLDLDIKSALDRELKLIQAGGGERDRTADDTFRAGAAKLRALAHPFVPVSKQSFEFWCLHPDVARKTGARLLKDAVGDPRIDGAFARNELVFLRMTYGLLATDLPSMREAHGIYRQAYDNRIRLSRESPPRSSSPHLDWRWDSPAFLPEIDDGQQKQAMRNLRRAVLYTLVMDGCSIFKGSDDGEQVWIRSMGPSSFSSLTDMGNQPVSPTIHGLHLGLAVNYGLVKDVLVLALEKEETLRQQPEQVPLVVKLANTLDALLQSTAGAPTRAEGERLRNQLISTLFNEVHDIFFRALRKPNSAKRSAEVALSEAHKNSLWLTQGDASQEVKALVNSMMQEALKPRQE
ncbi:MAG: tubulin-like doman-containing protein [Panacagrimonas sp.]